MLITVYALFMSFFMLAATVVVIRNETSNRANFHTKRRPGL